MRTWKPLLVLLLALAATELVSSEQDRDLDQASYDVVRDDGGDDGEGDFDQIVTDAAKKVCETFSDDGAKRSVLLEKRRRSWIRKVWKAVKPIAIKIIGALGKRDLEEALTDGESQREVTLQKTKRGWGKKLWGKIKKVIIPVVRPPPTILYGRRRYLTEALTDGESQRDVTLQKTKRGWGKKLWGKIKEVIKRPLTTYPPSFRKKRDLPEMRREDGDSCHDPETAEMVEAVGTLAAVTDMMASAEGCDAEDGE